MNKPSLLEALEERRAGFGIPETEELLHASLQMPTKVDETEEEEEESWHQKVLAYLDLIKLHTTQLMVKGAPITAWTKAQPINITSESIDFRGFNGGYVEVDISGLTPSATIYVLGGSYKNGIFRVLPDANATKAAVNAATSYIVAIPSPWVRIQIASISGTFALDQGFQVTITPYRQ